MKTQVKNLVTGEENIFVNDLSLTENIVNVIIINNKRTGELLNKNLRAQIKQENQIVESKSKITGNNFAYCIDLNLHAKQIK